jgi:hypothetical protein
MTNGNASKINARGLRIASILLVGGIALTACGSSSSGGNTASPPNSVAPTGVAPTTAAPVGNSGGGSDSGSTFCKFAKAEQAQQTTEAQELTTDSPAQLGTFIQHAFSALSALAAAAPSAIKSDVQILVAADQAIFTALKNAKYNYKNVSPTTFTAVDTPAFKKATTAITTYLATSCGILPSGAPTP